MKFDVVLANAWKARNELWKRGDTLKAEAEKLSVKLAMLKDDDDRVMAEGFKLGSEADKIRFEAGKLRAEALELRADGNKLWANLPAVTAKSSKESKMRIPIEFTTQSSTSRESFGVRLLKTDLTSLPPGSKLARIDEVVMAKDRHYLEIGVVYTDVVHCVGPTSLGTWHGIPEIYGSGFITISPGDGEPVALLAEDGSLLWHKH